VWSNLHSSHVVDHFYRCANRLRHRKFLGFTHVTYRVPQNEQSSQHLPRRLYHRQHVQRRFLPDEAYWFHDWLNPQIRFRMGLGSPLHHSRLVFDCMGLIRSGHLNTYGRLCFAKIPFYSLQRSSTCGHSTSANKRLHVELSIREPYRLLRLPPQARN